MKQMAYDTDQLIGCAMQGRPPASMDFSTAQRVQLIERIKLHGVGPLLHRAGFRWPADVALSIRELAHSQVLWENAHQAALHDALRALQEHGIAPLLLKGSSLAYSLYEEPWLRTRADSDLLVPQHSRSVVARALQSAGFEAVAAAGGEIASYQSSWQRRADIGMQFLDVHWRINNSQVLAGLFDYDELRARVRPLPLLAPDALGADLVDAFLIACLHRLTHRHNPYQVGGAEHHDPDRLIWLLDVDLLARAFDAKEWTMLCERAMRKGLAAVCLDGLQTAHRYLGTSAPEQVRQALAGAGSSELPWRYLEGGRARQLWMDWKALQTPKRRGQWLRELLIPPEEYMRKRFPGSSSQSLAWLYIKRIAGGAYRRVTRHAAD
jgi:hypothetical protein